MIKQNNMNNKNNMLALSQERFSARKFTPEAVSQEDLDYIMECVRLAPSAVNRQPWHWLIVRSDEAKQKLQQCYDREWFKTAPMYIVGMRNVDENWVRRYDEKPHGDIDVAIATEHLCLAATERGLGPAGYAIMILRRCSCYSHVRDMRLWSSFLSGILPMIVLVPRRSARR